MTQVYADDRLNKLEAAKLAADDTFNELQDAEEEGDDDLAKELAARWQSQLSYMDSLEREIAEGAA